MHGPFGRPCTALTRWTHQLVCTWETVYTNMFGVYAAVTRQATEARLLAKCLPNVFHNVGLWVIVWNHQMHRQLPFEACIKSSECSEILVQQSTTYRLWLFSAGLTGKS